MSTLEQVLIGGRWCASLDAQGSFRIAKGFSAIVSGLNLTNEVFGFYQGSPIYPIQREYYHPTISAGIRWTPTFER